MPSATYWTDQETSCGVIYDSKQPYSAKRLTSLYGSYAYYPRRYETATRRLVAQGWLLPEDAAGLKPVATPDDFDHGTPLPRR